MFASYLIRVRPSKALHPAYLKHYCRSSLYWHQIEAQAVGAAQPGVNASKLKTLKIPLPPIDEQRRIAAILEKADAIRRKRQQARAVADEFLRSAFLEMFGDPVTNPRGWDIVELEAAADIYSGITKGKNLSGRKVVSLPYMRVANVQDGHIDLTEIKEIELVEDEVERFLLKPGDVLLTEGGDPDKLGRGAVWKGQIERCVHQNHIFRVSCNSTIANPEFVSAQIGSTRGKRYFLRSAKQTTGIATINKTQLKAFPLLIPPIEKQDEYARSVSRIGRWKERLIQGERQADNLFASLSQRAFRGEL